MGRPTGWVPTTSATRRSARSVAGDLVTLCRAPCLRRAVKLEQELGRPGTRAQLQALDPEQPLYDAAAIAALKAKHSGPLRSSRIRVIPLLHGARFQSSESNIAAPVKALRTRRMQR